MIHNNYKRLKWHEKKLVDDVLKIFMSSAKTYTIPIKGDDRIEKVAEAMATCIVESDDSGQERNEVVEESD